MPTPEVETTLEIFPEIPITDPSQPVRAQAGEDFQIIINSNPTTGYHWEIVGELDAKLVEFTSRDYNNVGPIMPGSGGVDIWTFKAVSDGETQITFGSYPPSLDSTDPSQTVTFNISIK